MITEQYRKIRNYVTPIGYILCCLFSLSQASCGNKDKAINGYSAKYADAIKHYSDPKDSLKLRALHFLIDNLSDQYSYSSTLLDQYKKEVGMKKDPSIQELITIYDSLSKTRPEPFRRDSDANFITGDFLIDNVEWAFKSRSLPWAKQVNFNDFCEYVLPYKASNEAPEYWRRSVFQRYGWIIDSVAKNKGYNDVITSVNLINNELSKWYKMSLSYDYPVDIGFEYSTHVKTGTCGGASSMALFPMRSLGLPVSYDYVPCWGNRSGKHNWNAIIMGDGHYTFNAAEATVGSHKVGFVGVDRMAFKSPKVFRKTYSIQMDALASIAHTSDELPEALNNKRIKDVTERYVPVSDVTVTVAQEAKDRFAYLCVFNNKDWVPAFWGTLSQKKASFKKMGRDIAYLPVLFSQGKIKPISPPLLIKKNGSVTVMKPSKERIKEMYITRKYPEDSSNEVKSGDLYELLYWNNGWISVGRLKASAGYLKYNNVPAHALYLLKDLSEGIQERIFTYENSKQVWW